VAALSISDLFLSSSLCCAAVQGCQIFIGTTYQNGKNILNDHKMYQLAKQYTIWPINRQICHKNTNIFYCKTFQNLPKLGFLVRKYMYHQATLLLSGFSILLGSVFFKFFSKILYLLSYYSNANKIVNFIHAWKVSFCVYFPETYIHQLFLCNLYQCYKLFLKIGHIIDFFIDTRAIYWCRNNFRNITF
jgi:hypothetical protein